MPVQGCALAAGTDVHLWATRITYLALLGDLVFDFLCCIEVLREHGTINPLIFENFNTGLQWCGQQSPRIICIASTKSLLGSYVLYNVHAKSLIERECELNYQKNREQIGKKYLIFTLYNLTILTQKSGLLTPVCQEIACTQHL